MIVFTRLTYFPLFCYIIRQCQTMYERGYYKNKIPIIFHRLNKLLIKSETQSGIYPAIYQFIKLKIDIFY